MEWLEAEGVVMREGRREWVDLTNPELFKSVYVEKKILWARRFLAASDPNKAVDPTKAVAWPARVSKKPILH